jgi:predicted O-methyltransferase YrrM
MRGGPIDRMARRVYHALVSGNVNLGEAPSESGNVKPGDSPSELIPIDDADEILPGVGQQTVSLKTFGWKWGDLCNLETLVLLCQLAALNDSPIIEFGTFRGRTTYNLAINAPRGPVISIDAGASDDSAANIARQSYPHYTPGELLHDLPGEVSKKIHLLVGDSRQLDLSTYYDSCGLVFVDGGHSYEVCMSDSLVALKLVRRGGVVIWDDLGPFWPGVQRTVFDLSRKYRICHLRKLGAALFVSQRESTKSV